MWVVKSHMSRAVNLGVGHYPPVRGQGPETPPPIMWFVQVTWFKVWTGISWSDKGSWCQLPPPLFNDSRSYLVSMTSFALLPNSLKEWPFSFRMHTYSWVSCRDDSPRLCSSLNCASYLVFGSCQPKWTFVTLINHMMKRALLHNEPRLDSDFCLHDPLCLTWLQGGSVTPGGNPTSGVSPSVYRAEEAS